METSLTSFLSEPESTTALTVAPWVMVVLLLLVVWSLVWKGMALWKAARLSHKGWFMVLLIVNTVGILEIIYIFLIAKKQPANTRDSQPSNL